MTRITRLASGSALVVLCAACGDGAFISAPDSTEGAQSAGTVSSAIIDGEAQTANPMAAAAVYHRHSGEWYAHPCSGRVLNPRPRLKAILTAKHCVIEDPFDRDLDSPQLDLSDIRVTAAVAPGVPDPNPPSSARTPIGLNVADGSRDLALIWVTDDIGQPANPAVVGLNLAPTEDFVSEGGSVDHYGYGLFVAGDDSSGGVLRAATGFPLIDWDSDTTYQYTNTGSGGEAMASGDSGCPGLVPYTLKAGTVYQQLGVLQGAYETSNEGSDTAIAENWSWLQERLIYVYLRTLARPGRRITVSDLRSGTLVRTEPNGPGIYRSGLIYSHEDQTIRFWAWGRPPTTCMTLKDDTPVKNQPLCVQPCNGGDAQRFTMNTRFQIQMAAYPDMCVAERSSYDVVIQPCSVVARKTWVWDYDIGRQ